MRTIRILTALALGAASTVAVLPAAQAATFTVSAGQSIQTAIDNASPGDTISIGPGTYSPFVVYKNDLTIIGHNTVVKVPSAPGLGYGVCLKAYDSACAFGPPVAGISGTVSGIAVIGNRPSFSDGFLVIGGLGVTFTNDTAKKNNDDGFDILFSTGVTVSNSRSNNDTAGFDPEESYQVVLTNDQASGDGFAFFDYQSHNVTISNDIGTGGCTGLIAGDASDVSVSNDNFSNNTKACPYAGLPQTFKAIGAIFLDTSGVNFTHNSVSGNGIATKKIYTGGLVVDQTPSDAGNVFANNAFANNVPRDIWADDANPPDNAFTENACSISVPTGLCS